MTTFPGVGRAARGQREAAFRSGCTAGADRGSWADRRSAGGVVSRPRLAQDACRHRGRRLRTGRIRQGMVRTFRTSACCYWMRLVRPAAHATEPEQGRCQSPENGRKGPWQRRLRDGMANADKMQARRSVSPGRTGRDGPETHRLKAVSRVPPSAPQRAGPRRLPTAVLPARFHTPVRSGRPVFIRRGASRGVNASRTVPDGSSPPAGRCRSGSRAVRGRSPPDRRTRHRPRASLAPARASARRSGVRRGR